MTAMSMQTAFEGLHRATGIAPLTAPQLSGEEASLPTPYRAGAAAGVAHGFAAAAAAEIWRFRGGDRQEIAVDLPAAAASLQPCYRLNGTLMMPGLPASPLTGFYQSGDQRWLHLHGGYRPQAGRICDLLNARNTPEALLDAVAKWNGSALEDALAFLGQCGAIVRTPEEWAGTVPGRMAAAPIVLTKLGDGPKAALGDCPTPLGGLKVLDLTRAVAGPLSTRLLASFGAEVLQLAKGASPETDDLDRIYGAGKRRTYLDLAEPAGAEAARRLARQADIVVESYRPGALAKLGFSAASLAHAHPGMITVTISAFGLSGPWANRRGFEETVQAACGLAAGQGAFEAARSGQRDIQPRLIGVPVLSALTGLLAAAGALAAVLKRIREGGSWQVEVSLAATAVWLSSLGRIDAARVPEAFEALAGLDQYLQICETKDGWFECLGPVVRMSKTPPQWGPLPETVTPPHWASAHGEANAVENQSA